MRVFKGEYVHFSFIKCHIYTHDGANAKFSTNSHEMDYSVTGCVGVAVVRDGDVTAVQHPAGAAVQHGAGGEVHHRLRGGVHHSPRQGVCHM